MCELCEEEEGGQMIGCPDCGRLICFDIEPSDVDVVDRAYVTTSGDLYCCRCGRQQDQAEEEEFDEFYPSEWQI